MTLFSFAPFLSAQTQERRVLPEPHPTDYANVALVPVRQQQFEKVNATGPEYFFPYSGGGKTQ